MSDQQQQTRSADGFISTVLAGRLGADPDMRYTPGGSAVTNMRLALNLRVPKNQNWEVQTMWVQVTSWGKLAETCNRFLKKGSKILVDVDRWIFDEQTGGPELFTRNNGNPGTAFAVVARSVRFLDSKSDGANGNGQVEQTAEEVINFA